MVGRQSETEIAEMTKKIILSRKSKQVSTPWVKTKKGFRVKLTRRITEEVSMKETAEMTLNCPRCNAPVFIKIPKEEWYDPGSPIYECKSCGYNEVRFE